MSQENQDPQLKFIKVEDVRYDKLRAAERTLENLNYTYHGGELWKPPLGKAPPNVWNTRTRILDQINESLASGNFSTPEGAEVLTKLAEAWSLLEGKEAE